MDASSASATASATGVGGSTGTASPPETTRGPAETTGVTTTTTTTGACDPATPILCDGVLFSCGDGKDNDGDGLFDLDDPECIGPCDDDEAFFQVGLPDFDYCEIDCAFDGNSGMGDDGCFHDLACDPLDPVDDVNCQYMGGAGCLDEPVTGECVDFCSPLTPNGCDCFGCCAMDIDGELRTVQILQPQCSTSTPEGCPACTPRLEECGNPCEACEICFGETELPAGCAEVECGNRTPCEGPCDCDEGEFCIQGCCHPDPPS